MADAAISTLFDAAQAAPQKNFFYCQMCDGLHPRTSSSQRFCVSCSAEGRRLLAIEKDREKGAVPVGAEVTCRDCDAVFIKTGTAHFRCKACAKAAASSQSIASAKKKRQETTIMKPVAIGYCEMCKSVYPYRARKRFCDPCAIINKKEYGDRWAADNKQAIAEKSARYMEKNSDLVNERKRERRKKNPEAEAAYRKSQARKESIRRHYDKNRENPTAQINQRMANAIRLSLKGRKAGRHWESLVDYTVEDLVLHLERQFSEGMSWENMGKWHIDHRVPKSSFKYISPECEGFKAAWAITNLQPLWAVDNLRKHAKLDFLL
ncbi:hypothetical protein ACC782_33690 [Rhizobium ruizarguesonis]